MKIKELKVGDRVKYYAPDSWKLDTTMVRGVISEVLDDYVRIDDAFLIDKTKIISKIIEEKVEKKETFIDYYEFKCLSCGKGQGFKIYHGIVSHKLCPNCEMGLKTEPKTFSFEIIVTRDNLGGGYYAHHPNDGFINTFGGYTVKGNTQVDFNGLLAPEWMELGKSYTVEIKEKSEKV